MKSGIKQRKAADLLYICMVILSSVIYALGFNIFVRSANLFPGGYSGLARLISEITIHFTSFPVRFSLLYFLLNALTTLFVWRRIGHKFILLSILFYTLTAFFTAILPVFPITADPLLASVFGGLLNGFAMGLALRNNASSGGTDFIAIYLSMKFNSPTWNYLLAANAVILFLAGLLFGWNQALYSIIFQFVSTQIVNTMHQRYKSTRIHVVTDLPDQVCAAVFHTCRHGITKIPCEGGFTDKSHWLLLITINTYQLKEVLQIIAKTDPHAFMTISEVERIYGNYYQKPLE